MTKSIQPKASVEELSELEALLDALDKEVPAPAPVAEVASQPAQEAVPAVEPVKHELSGLAKPNTLKGPASLVTTNPNITGAAPGPVPGTVQTVTTTVGLGTINSGAMIGSKQEIETLPVTEAPTSKLKWHIDIDAFKRDSQVTERNFQDKMMEQSGDKAHYNHQAAMAESQADKMKARFDVLEAELYDKHRKALALKAEKTTEKAIENAVKLDPKWLALCNLVIESKTIARIARGCVDALSDRKDMIIQLGAYAREELKGQIRTMATPEAAGERAKEVMRATSQKAA